MKQVLFDYLNEHLKPARAEYQRLIDDPAEVERALVKGAAKARDISVPYLAEIRHAVGVRKLG
jgi:tryptophanyl-tRNA synthetase